VTSKNLARGLSDKEVAEEAFAHFVALLGDAGLVHKASQHGAYLAVNRTRRLVASTWQGVFAAPGLPYSVRRNFSPCGQTWSRGATLAKGAGCDSPHPRLMNISSTTYVTFTIRCAEGGADVYTVATTAAPAVPFILRRHFGARLLTSSHHGLDRVGAPSEM
jgi:hypothetical protein